MKRKFKRSLFALTLLSALACLTQPVCAQMLVTYQQAESSKDKRFDYDIAVLRLALEKTRKEYGDFHLQPSPPMNRARASADARNRAYPNFFVKLSYEDGLAGKELSYARFPIDRGIADYRICFVRSELKARLAATSTLTKLKRYSHGQGIGWADVDILKANGFTVQPVSDYESLFRMVAVGRFDLFCRGVNEILDEYRLHRDIPHLDYDSSFALVYPLPRFFFTHSANKAALARVDKGLRIAYQDGSLQALWLKQYHASIAFAKLRARRLFRIDNPLIHTIDFDFHKYDFDPLNN